MSDGLARPGSEQSVLELLAAPGVDGASSTGWQGVDPDVAVAGFGGAAPVGGGVGPLSFTDSFSGSTETDAFWALDGGGASPAFGQVSDFPAEPVEAGAAEVSVLGSPSIAAATSAPMSGGVDSSLQFSLGEILSEASVADTAAAVGDAGQAFGGVSGAANAVDHATRDPVSDKADQDLHGSQARAAYHVTGAGIKVGIISNSFNLLGGAAADEADGALPSASNVHILQDMPKNTANPDDEGRGMAELVHSLAPGAQIYFDTGVASEAQMVKAINALRAAKCKIICDDLNFFDEPMFQLGDPIEAAINAFVSAGGVYLTNATNFGSSYYESSFNAFNDKGVIAHNFGTATDPVLWEPISVPKSATVDIDLQWKQPFASFGKGGGSDDSLSVFVAGTPGGSPFEILNANKTGKDPVQSGSFTNNTGHAETVYFAVTLSAGVAPGLFEIILTDNSRSPVVIDDAEGNAGIGTGDIAGHNMDPDAITVAAAPENDPTAAEPFSSHGPGVIFYSPSGALLSTPVVLDKPDITAVDGNTTSISQLSPFYGTSAATPAAAGVAALMLQENARLTANDVKDLLEDSATHIGAAGHNSITGAGLINADKAVGFSKVQSGGLLHISGSGPTLLGTHLADLIAATGSGTVTIEGGAGNDTLAANSGADILDGGTGINTLIGGAGADIFLFDTALNGSLDHIKDFAPARDKINLSHSVFTKLSVGALTATEFYYNPKGAGANSSADRIIYDAANGGLYYDANGRGAGGETEFAVLSAHLGITRSDFSVV